ncbi:phosphate-starvation-inducible PsiE family protein [Paenibacillus validus]|uniref:phosphate-starvation-inducible protein PsiE n=1 Tax=Paenibacillus TaxID=44249 RepID=UPI000FDC6463|nr:MULTISPECIES: phosphate-starvation-inducible PsiE family protein [Paenibacillus]MED4603755.1 phosphate-starvation-inducible PsiE family protein [Paenibacillus validus]MED4609231.1 phosphate-starvation-inducible PsiE family protein [Paenibacillus validus]
MNNRILNTFQFILNGSLILLGIILTFLMIRELWIILLSTIQTTLDIHIILQEILAFFLYFAFVSMIVKYFRENYHFPIRYLLYIGITGTLRFIIVNRDHPMENLILSFVILVLMIAYSLKITSSQH